LLEPTPPPRYPRLPPTESVAVHPRPSRSRPRQIQEAFVKLSSQPSWERRARPWRPRRNIERHSEVEIRHVNPEWKVARRPPEPTERIPLLHRLKIIFVSSLFFKCLERDNEKAIR